MQKKERPPSLGASQRSLSPASSRRFLSPQGNKHFEFTKTTADKFSRARK